MKRMLKYVGIAMIFCMLFSVISFASNGVKNEQITYRSISIVVNGTEIAPCDVNGNSTEPFIRNADGSTYLPVRAVAGALGLDVGWEDKTSTVILKSNGTVKTGTNKPVKTNKTVKASLYYRDIVITLDGKAVALKNAKGEPVEPFIKDGTTYIPVRAVATALGCEVGWNGDTNTVTITKSGGSSDPAGPENPAVDDTLKITDYTKSASAEVGKYAEFSVTVGGGKAPYTYKWQYYFDGKWYDITDTLAAFTVDGNKLKELIYEKMDSRDVRCIVTDATGKSVTSESMKCFRSIPLTITEDKLVAKTKPSSTSEFNVSVSGGTAPYTYEWEYYDNVDKDWVKAKRMSAFQENGSNLTVRYSATSDGFSYSIRCIVKDANGNTAMSKEMKSYCRVDDMEVAVMVSKVAVEAGKFGVAEVKVKRACGAANYFWEYYDSEKGNWESCADKPAKFTDMSTKLAQKDDNNDSLYKVRCTVTDETGASVVSGQIEFYTFANNLMSNQFLMYMDKPVAITSGSNQGIVIPGKIVSGTVSVGDSITVYDNDSNTSTMLKVENIAVNGSKVTSASAGTKANISVGFPFGKDSNGKANLGFLSAGDTVVKYGSSYELIKTNGYEIYGTVHLFDSSEWSSANSGLSYDSYSSYKISKGDNISLSPISINEKCYMPFNVKYLSQNPIYMGRTLEKVQLQAVKGNSIYYKGQELYIYSGTATYGKFTITEIRKVY